MTHQIDNNLERLELHDSSILSLTKAGKNLIMVFDWAKLADFREKGFDLIIIGKSQLILENLFSEKFIEEKVNSVSNQIDCPNDFFKYFTEIGENESKTDQTMKITGLYRNPSEFKWINWIIEFEKFSFSWENFVTSNEWDNGKIPE